MKKATLLLLAGLARAAAGHAAPLPTPAFGFEENKAQWPTAARYRALVPGGAVWLRATGFTYDWISTADLRRYDAAQAAQAAARPQPGTTVSSGPDHPAPPPPMRLHGHAITVDFVGAAPTRPLQANHPLAAYTNYFIGTDSSKWASRVRTYAAVTYPQLYPGVDVRVHGSASGQFEYDVVVAPAANPALVRLRYRGAAKLQLRADGALAITTSVGEVREQRPVAWQVGADGQRQAVPCRFQLVGEVLSFEMPAGYDQKRELVIDPVVQASTYTGVVGTPMGSDYDAAGNMYVGLNVNIAYTFPQTPGAYTAGGGGDMAVCKFNPSGTALLYTTKLGGRGAIPNDYLQQIKVDAGGNLYIAGLSRCNNFPMLPTSYDPSPGMTTPSRGEKIILAKLNPTGTVLLGATYLGGVQYRHAVSDITFGPNGSVYVAGATYAADFPTTPGTYRPTYGAGAAPNREGFISRLDANLTTMIWSTLMAGPTPTSLTTVSTVRVSAAGLVYFIAVADALMPIPAGAASSTPGGAFIGCLSANGAQLLHATYIPGTPSLFFPTVGVGVFPSCIEFDLSGNLVVLGSASGGCVHATAGAFNHPQPLPSTSQFFVAKLTPTLSTMLQLSVVAADMGFISANRTLRVDNCGNLLYILGIINNISPTPQVSAPVISSIAGGLGTGLALGYYLGALNADGSRLLFGTYYGSGGGGFGAIDG